MQNIDKANLETYIHWKNECAQKGKTPMDMIQFAKDVGLNDYAEQLLNVIQKMEALSSGQG